MNAYPLLRRLDSNFVVLLVLFNALNILDALTTSAGLSCGYTEGNAYFAQLLASTGAWAYAIKIGLFLFFTFVLYRMRQAYVPRPRAGSATFSTMLFGVVLLVIVCLGVVVLSNTIRILQC